MILNYLLELKVSNMKLCTKKCQNNFLTNVKLDIETLPVNSNCWAYSLEIYGISLGASLFARCKAEKTKQKKFNQNHSCQQFHNLKNCKSIRL